MGEKIEINTNENQFELVRENNQISIELSKGLIKVDDVRLLEATTNPDETLLPGSIVDHPDTFEWQYQAPSNMVTTDNVQKNRNHVDRIKAAMNISNLSKFQNSRVIPLIHPDNILWDENLMPHVIHRGLKDIVPPLTQENNDFLNAYKSLAMTLVERHHQFDELNHGTANRLTNNPFVKSVNASSSVDELNKTLEKAYDDEFDRYVETTVTVPKSTQKIYRIGFYLMTVIAIALAATVAYFMLIKAPFDQKMTSSQTSFLSDDYDKVIDKLENVSPKKLPKANKYILATSYVNVEKLSTTQKQNVLNNVTLNSDNNYLLFWIYDGRGNFDESLNLAKYINDDQLILYSYTKLYDQANSNTNLSGSKKQALLKKYQKQITKYSKKVGGAKDDVTQ